MRVTAKVDYAMRAVVVLANAASEGAEPVKGDAIAAAQEIPGKYLENILGELRLSGIVRSQRGADGGYRLARPAGEISVADVIRAVEGPLANVRGEAPEELNYPNDVDSLQEVWIATRAALRSVLEEVSVSEIASGKLPRKLEKLVEPQEAWERPWLKH